MEDEPMGTRTYFVASALIFAVVAILHLLRSLNHWTFQIGTLALPLWLSWIGMFVAAGLSVWGFRLARR